MPNSPETNQPATAPEQTDVNALFGTETAQPTPTASQQPEAESAPINVALPDDVTAPVTQQLPVASQEVPDEKNKKPSGPRSSAPRVASR